MRDRNPPLGGFRSRRKAEYARDGASRRASHPRRPAGGAVACVRARRAARGRDNEGASRARERRLGAVALARTRGCAARVPLARSAREPDRVGRHPVCVPRGRAPGRDRRGRVAAHGTASARALPPGVRPRGGVPLLVSGARVDDARPRRRRQAANRRAAPHGSPARPARSRGGGSARGAAGAARHRRRHRPSHISSPALSPPPTGHDFCSMRTPRATRPWAARSTPSRGPTVAAWPPGLRAVAAIPGSPSRSSSRRSSTASSRRRTTDFPRAPAGDGLFEGRAVVRLRSRSGRPSG